MIKNMAGFEIEVNKKKIKNMYLSVLPDGKIRISAPNHMTYKEIERFVASKADWIRDRQLKMADMPTPHEYKSGETLYLFGNAFTLSVTEGNKNSVSCNDGFIFMNIKSADTNRLSVINEWYRQMLKEKISAIFPECERKTGLYAESCQVRNMKTRWGSCNTRTKKIWLNLQLAKMPEICLEYVIYHELAHLAAPNHGPEFKGLMDKFMPQWRDVKKQLNHEYTHMQ